jgi:16S rRNA U1498 N3-methylase RsmE
MFCSRNKKNGAALALDSGFVTVSLGDTVLRVATAAAYIEFTVNG